jgi:hypothetical protein
MPMSLPVVANFAEDSPFSHRKYWGHPLAASGQLAKRIPDASHHLIPMVAT